MAGDYHSVRVTSDTFRRLQRLQRHLLARAGAFAQDRAYGVTQGDVVAVAIAALESREGIIGPPDVAEESEGKSDGK